MKNQIENWIRGYTQSELDAAQERYNLVFPPDLIGLYLEKQPSQGYDWIGENERIRRMLDWPFECLQFDVEHNGLWWPEWGARSDDIDNRACVLRAQLENAPKLIPLISHRFIPDDPGQAYNPVFSMYGQDTIYYGANLTEYFDNEFNRIYRIGSTKRIRFWSDLVDRNE